MSAPSSFTPFAVGNTQPQARPRRFPAGARSHIARVTRAQGARDEQFDQQSSSSSPDSNNATFSTPPANGEYEPVFGPSHPLYALISAHLPDVLARLVISYQTPLLPRGQHYRGHVLLQYGVYGYRDQREQSMTANPLSLHRRSFSWSGWMNRTPHNNARRSNHFLLSFKQPHHPGEPDTGYWLHIGYRKHYNRQHDVAQNQCFTFAFFSNDLDARPADTDLDTFGSWEHWSGSFEYPRSQSTPPIVNDSTFTSEQARNFPAGAVLGRRRLYRNGRLVVEDDCLPMLAGEQSKLVVGNYEDWGNDMALDGGVCDVRIYSRVLSETDCRNLYEGEEHEVSGEGLEAHWPLDSDKHIPHRSLLPSDPAQAQGRARVMLDVSGNERHLEMKRYGASIGMESRYHTSGQV